MCLDSVSASAAEIDSSLCFALLFLLLPGMTRSNACRDFITVIIPLKRGATHTRGEAHTMFGLWESCSSLQCVYMPVGMEMSSLHNRTWLFRSGRGCAKSWPISRPSASLISSLYGTVTKLERNFSCFISPRLKGFSCSLTALSARPLLPSDRCHKYPLEEFWASDIPSWLPSFQISATIDI